MTSLGGAYLVFTRVSALMVLRWFVAETGIPVEVRNASWKIGLKKLMQGSIDELSVDVYYKPLKLYASLQTPVDYIRKKDHWSIRLKPTLRLADFAPIGGRIDLELDKKAGTLVEFDLRFLADKSSHLKGQLRWNPLENDVSKRWTAKVEVFASGLKTVIKDATTSIGTARLDADLSWPEKPPFPIVVKSKLQLDSLQLISDKVFATEANLTAQSDFTFDGKRFEHVDVSVDKPVRLRLSGWAEPGTQRSEMQFGMNASLADLVDERLASWLENLVPVIHQAKARGKIAVHGQVSIDRDVIHANGNLDLNVLSATLPTRRLTIEDLTLKTPLSYPAAPEWGQLNVKVIDFHSVKLKNILLDVRLASDSISLTTEDSEGDDRPIRQSVWGGAIDIAQLYANVPISSTAKPEFTASVTGGPFALEMIQSDLCILPDRPLNGALSFTYPQIVQDKNSLRMIGDTNLGVFNGAAHIGDMQLVFTGDNPKLQFDLDWSDLDLHAIGDYTRFGDMRGSLDGSLVDTTLALTPIGPVPLTYDLTIRGRERSAKKVRFYGRAIDNILVMMGNPQAQAGVAGALLKIATTWRNWMPATAEYMGFRAKSDGSWTELSTFDPPGAKKHYFLYGTAFTIPLNSHGVYPVVMKTAAFHGWLAGMIEYFKGRTKNENEQKQSQCTPLW